jgi:hypothetical protein
MTLKADGVDFGFGEELWITAPVRRMTGYATGLLDCLVLVDPGAGHLCVALEAGRNLLSDSGLQLRLEDCMQVVALRTFDWTAVGLVMNRRVERGFCCCVALVAERGLGSFQQLRFFGGVN